MAELHDALKNLGMVDWSDVPQDNVAEYMQHAFAAGELICNSVPPPANGEPFDASKPHLEQPNTAGTSKEIHPSSVRNFPTDAQHEGLQKNWGKPYKFDKTKNPQDVALYKMAGKDRHGAWFARRSVHEGMGIDKFRRAMQREFAHSLSVQGGAGAGAVRGLAADRRVESLGAEGVGKLEVYELSAQFPGPTTPREFIPLVMTTEDALSEKSATEVQGGRKYVPRHFMIVSRPIEHPDTPERTGFVRGKYESVELIREIPLHPVSAGGDGTNGERQKPAGDAKGDPELNPVEWIMITRSDPGGGIPRFLVDRGTPEAMLGDMTKFLDWATGFGDRVPDPEEDLDKQQQASEQNAKAADTQEQPTTTPAEGVANTSPDHAPKRKPATEPAPQQDGIMSKLEAGLDAYAPVAVSSGYHNYMHPDEEDSSSSSDSTSVNSFMSAESMRDSPEAAGLAPPNASTEALSLASRQSSAELAFAGKAGDKDSTNPQEKEVLKVAREREKVDRKLAKKRAEEEEKLKKSQEKDQSEQDKVKEKLAKDMKKAEEKHRKEIEKLERKKEKEAKKLEDKRRKKDDASKLSMVSRERDEFRGQLDSFKRENQLLLGRIEELQRENTVMAGKLGKLGGNDALKAVHDELGEGGRRPSSMDSKRSLGSVPAERNGHSKEALGL
ncbi:hypothetical protein B0A50_07022 [Salinomyces thailandicus]|uniref:DUF3074 domain-containing protein n=1 Tax=Salinomyces thailandicus TaxID=706561 RepID=A0A4U0TPJ4_9PEZI|nr:hypothetical protein B0A50_07022 [Salinomyces thailandica]